MFHKYIIVQFQALQISTLRPPIGHKKLATRGSGKDPRLFVTIDILKLQAFVPGT